MWSSLRSRFPQVNVVIQNKRLWEIVFLFNGVEKDGPRTRCKNLDTCFVFSVKDRVVQLWRFKRHAFYRCEGSRLKRNSEHRFLHIVFGLMCRSYYPTCVVLNSPNPLEKVWPRTTRCETYCVWKFSSQAFTNTKSSPRTSTGRCLSNTDT